MPEKLIQRYGGKGQLVIEDKETISVNYLIGEFQEFIPDGLGGELPTLRNRRGTITHAEGHQHWHPIATLHTDPLTLILDDGRRLKVFLTDVQGSFKTEDDFF